MKKLLEIIRGVRRIELLLLIAAIAVLVLQSCSFGTIGSSDLEDRLCAILSAIEGVGEVRVMVVEGEQGVAEGVLVVAEGADDAGTCIRIQRAVKTLLGIELSRIEVARCN